MVLLLLVVCRGHVPVPAGWAVDVRDLLQEAREADTPGGWVAW
jgi:hypothetical protein